MSHTYILTIVLSNASTKDMSAIEDAAFELGRKFGHRLHTMATTCSDTEVR